MNTSNPSRLRTAINTALAGLLAMTAGGTHAALQGRDLNGDGAADAYYDTVLDITWLKDGNAGKGSSYDTVGGVPGSNGPNDGWMNHADATAWAASLNVFGVTGWRLPTTAPVNGTAFQNATSFNGSTDNGYNGSTAVSEMGYMFYQNLGMKGYCKPASVFPNCITNAPAVAVGVSATNMGPFVNIQSNAYWTDVSSVVDSTKAMSFGYQNGYQWTNNNLKSDSLNAWAVHDGNVVAVPEAEGWAMAFSGFALLPLLARRVGNRRV